MRRIIINADDCGMSTIVNAQIEKAILARKISSTTVMANMDDFEGALKLYNTYSKDISFGWHLNLTEGTPLLYSQLLLDYGYYIERGDHVEFNGKKFWKKLLPKCVRDDIMKELITQYDKLSSSGIKISHMDSHQHIHTSPSMLLILPQLCNALDIRKVRNIRNYVPLSLSYIIRRLWGKQLLMRVNNSYTTQFFCSYKEFRENPNIWNFKTLELMCHPGHPGKQFEEEVHLLMNDEIDSTHHIISYIEL